MAYIQIGTDTVKYNDTTHDAVKIENEIIIGKGETIILKTDPKYVYWDKFGKPHSLKDYGKNALTISLTDYASDYWIMEGATPIYFDDAPPNNVLTVVEGINAPAKLDLSDLNLFDTDYPTIETVFKYTESIVLKDVDVLVGCGTVDKQLIIDTGELDLNTKKELRNRDGDLIDNYDGTKHEAVFSAIKDLDLTGANYNVICAAIEGV